jgi:outer membrane protein assembly factor BamD
MLSFKTLPNRALFTALSLGLLASCIHKKYETPITKNTQQPDKVLFDQAIKDIEHGRYEVARISLQTLMNTYESSEYMAKAKLAIADSWFREGGASGLAQAEAEYKDFILFYPQMEESAQAQNRVCEIHYKQMDKSDRDWTQTLRAEDECRQLIVQFPNSKFVPQATQRLRNIQESLAAHEFVVGNFYWKREMNPAAANRLNALVDQYPLYSNSGEALFEAGDAYSKMGPRFRQRSGEMFSRLIRDYPLSARVDDAKSRLQELELPIPNADPNALARAKYELANYHKPGMLGRTTGWLHSGPDVSHAAHSGTPTMTNPKVTIPGSVPLPAGADTGTTALAATNGTPNTDVTATTVSGSSALDTNPDARSSGGTAQTAANQPAPQALPTNRDKDLKQMRDKQAKKQAKLDKKKKKPSDQTPAPADGNGVAVQAPTGTTSNLTVPPTTTSKQPPSQTLPPQQ